MMAHLNWASSSTCCLSGVEYFKILNLLLIPFYFVRRHSRFGGTYVIKDVKSVSENDLIFHKPLSKAVTLTLDFEKVRYFSYML